MFSARRNERGWVARNKRILTQLKVNRVPALRVAVNKGPLGVARTQSTRYARGASFRSFRATQLSPRTWIGRFLFTTTGSTNIVSTGPRLPMSLCADKPKNHRIFRLSATLLFMFFTAWLAPKAFPVALNPVKPTLYQWPGSPWL